LEAIRVVNSAQMNVVREKMLCLFIALCGGGYMALNLFGPSPAVVVGEETTYLTAPLAEDGLPDYTLAILERQRAGVTHENNAAPLLWHAFGPAGVTAEEYDLICRELGMVQRPSQYLVDAPGEDLARRIALELRSRAQKSLGTEPTDDQTYAADELQDVISRQPWTIEQVPYMEAWLGENAAPLDTIVTAVERPRLYSPPPNWLVEKNTPSLVQGIPLLMNGRSAVRSLSVRAMNRIAVSDYDGAWSDILACWRLGSLIGKGPFLVDVLVGIAHRGVAAKSTLALLQADDLPPPVAERILRDLRAQSASLGMHDVFNYSERLYFHDFTLRTLTDRLGGIDLPDGLDTPPIVWGSVDANIVLRAGNKWYDDLAAIAALPRSPQRQAALDKFDAALEQMEDVSRFKTLLALASRTKRSELVADALVVYMTPSATASLKVHDRDRATLELTQIAAALAVFKAKHGKYPESLHELQPDILAEIPRDLYDSEELPRYARRKEGYLLYSVFENGVDDAGSSNDGELERGEWLPEARSVDPWFGDLVIRVPRPRKELPKAAPTR
jgi:hypothetical protein